MKKIMFYIDMMYRGGAQRVMANLIEYFHDRGYETALINDFIQDESRPQYPLPEDIERFYLRNSLEGNRILKNISRIRILRGIVKKEKPDVILSFLGRPNKRMLLSTIGLKTKKVVSVRNDPNQEYGSSPWKKLTAGLMFGLADGCVFQTEDAADYFPKSVRKKSAIILNPVNEKFFLQKREDTVEDIITVGRMEPQKNQKLLIDAFSSIAVDFPEDNLVIYGDGPMKEELKEYALSQGLEKRVQFPGNVANVEERLGKAKIFVLPSDYEGLPNALMEAMAVGVPCVSTDCPCGGPRTLIRNGGQGVLVPCKDPVAMKEAIKSLLSDDKKRNAISAGCRERANQFKPKLIFREWEKYLTGLEGIQ